MGQPVAVILAAGLGTRMKSEIPKVLHQVGGLPMIKHVIAALEEAGIKNIILVLGHQGQKVEEALGGSYQVVYQLEQLGTGHALLQALPCLREYNRGNRSGTCLVLCGDTPLLRSQTLTGLLAKHVERGATATILTAELDNPTGYGRIIKGSTGVEKIVEEKDASPEERLIREINTGTYCFDVKSLVERLGSLTPANAQGEYYLTDVIQYLARDGQIVETLCLENPAEAMGINNRLQLAEAEASLRKRILVRHMLEGVTVINPENTYVAANVQIGRDTVLYPGVILEGKTTIGNNCIIGPNTRIVDSIVLDDCQVQYSILQEARVAEHCTIGPFSYLRPGSVLEKGVKVGDFVELKKSVVGPGSKIPHLSYVGDSILGSGVNIGAGTITCNYDGINKHLTTIEDGAFIGSNTNLVAPITVGPGAYVGAGSTLTKDVPGGALAVARGRQSNIENWQEHKKKKE